MFIAKSGLLKFSICLIFILSIHGTSSAGTYSGGTGVEGDPYLISSAADLIELGQNSGDLNKVFTQTANINLANEIFFRAVIGGDVDFSTIGYQGTPFTGVYDGQGHIISQYNIVTSFGMTEYIGIFGYNQGQILNLRVEDCSIDLFQGQYVGLLCGRSNGIIERCFTSGDISCGEGSSYIGGFCGYNYNATATNCHSQGAVYAGTGSSFIGGLMGRIATYAYGSTRNSSIKTCSSMSNVVCDTNATYVGGFAGMIDCYGYGYMTIGGPRYGYAQMYVYDCFASGNVTVGNSSDNIGGFIGLGKTQFDDYKTQIIGYARGYIENCYYSGGLMTIGTESTYTGGFSGRTYEVRASLDLVANLWNTETSDLETSSTGAPHTDAQMRSVNLFLQYGWDFTGYTVNGTDDIWIMPPAESLYAYPLNKWHFDVISGTVSVPTLVSGIDNVFPNPFNPTTTILYSMANPGRINLTVFDLSGRKVKTLVNTHMDAGTNEVQWNGTGQSGERVASGLYFVRQTTEGAVQTRKIMLTK